MRFSLFRWLSQSRQAGLASPAEQDRLAQYNTYEARNLFSHLLERVHDGEQIVIARSGDPVAKLVPYDGAEPLRPGVIRAQLIVHDATPEKGEG